MTRSSVNTPRELGENIVIAATDFEESLAKYLEAEAEKIRALSGSFDKAYNATSGYDIKKMDDLFNETLASLHSIKRTILENMVLGSTLMNTPDETISSEPEKKTEVPHNEEKDTEADSVPSFIDSLPELENVLKELNIDSLFSSENLSSAKDVFNQLTQNLDLSSLDFSELSEGMNIFNNK